MMTRAEGGRARNHRPAARRLPALHGAARGCQLQPLVRQRHARLRPNVTTNDRDVDGGVDEEHEAA
jgi:hypothetical protein